MSMINTNYKAETTVPVDPTSTNADVAPVDQTSSDPSAAPTTETDSNADLKARLEEALRELEQYKEEYATSLTDESLAQMNRLEVMMKAEMAAIEAYGKGGYGPGGAAPVGSEWDAPSSLPPEFSVPEGYTLDIQQNASDASLCDDPGTYAGTVNFEGSRLNFSAQDEGIQEVEAVSKGKDLVLTVIYEDGHKKSWVIKDGSVRSEPIIIDATQMGHGVTIDTSRALRISDGKHGQPYGATTGFQIWGSDYDDTIYGSQGRDGIVGLAGNDKIDGGADIDEIYGDDKYELPGQYAQQINGLPAGSDDIRGGAGADIIRGGGGIDKGYSSDDMPGEAVDMGGEVKDDTASAPDPSGGWLAYDGNWTTETDEDGTIVLKNMGTEGGQIDLTMPNGYTMAMADIDPNDSTSLLITFVGEDANGNPQTFKLKIDGFFDSKEGVDPRTAVITLNVFGSENGDIIDFHKLMGVAELNTQNINIFGNGGNDIILGTESALVRDGVDTSNPYQSTVGDGTLNRLVQEGVFAESEEDEDTTYTASAENGQIVIRDADGDPSNNNATVELVAPEDFDRGYITVGPDGCTYVILAKNDGSGDTIVFKFEDPSLDYTKIFFWNQKPGEDDSKTSTEIRLIPVSFDSTMGYGVISGGDGSDVLFGSKDSNFDTDASDFVVKGSFKEDSTSSVETPKTTSTKKETDSEKDSEKDE